MSHLDAYRFDGGKKLNLQKLPTDSKKDGVDKEKILAKTEKNQAKIFALRRGQGQHHPSRHGRSEPAGRAGIQLQTAFQRRTGARLSVALQSESAAQRHDRHL